MIVNISVVLAAAAIVVLVIYAVLVLKEARRCLEQAQQSLGEAGRQMSEAAQQVVPLLQAGQSLTRDIQVKLDEIEWIWDCVRQTGHSIERAAKAVGSVSQTVAQTAGQAEQSIRAGSERISETAEWIGTGVKLWQTWQAHRREKPGKT